MHSPERFTPTPHPDVLLLVRGVKEATRLFFTCVADFSLPPSGLRLKPASHFNKKAAFVSEGRFEIR